MDVNKDKSITVSDVQRVANVAIGVTLPAWRGQGDIDGDSKTDVIDVQRIVNRILGP
jgi:hypothetical protein